MNRVSKGGTAAKQGRPSSRRFVAPRPAVQSNEVPAANDSDNDMQHTAAVELPARRFKPPRPASSIQTLEQLSEEQPALNASAVSGIKLQPYKKPRLQPLNADAAISSELLQLSPVPSSAVSRIPQQSSPSISTPTSSAAQQLDSSFSLFKVTSKAKPSLHPRDNAPPMNPAPSAQTSQTAKEVNVKMTKMPSRALVGLVPSATMPTRVTAAHDNKQNSDNKQKVDHLQPSVDGCDLAGKQTSDCDNLPSMAASLKPVERTTSDNININAPHTNPASQVEFTPTSAFLDESDNDTTYELDIPALPTAYTRNKPSLICRDTWATLSATVTGSALPDATAPFHPQIVSMQTVVSLLCPKPGLPLPSQPPDIQAKLTSRIAALIQQQLVSIKTDTITSVTLLSHRALVPYANPVVKLNPAGCIGQSHHTVNLMDAADLPASQAGPVQVLTGDDEDAQPFSSVHVQLADGDINKQQAGDVLVTSIAKNDIACTHDVFSGQDAEFLAISRSAELQWAELLRLPVDVTKRTTCCSITLLHDDNGIDWGQLVQMCQ